MNIEPVDISLNDQMINATKKTSETKDANFDAFLNTKAKQTTDIVKTEPDLSIYYVSPNELLNKNGSTANLNSSESIVATNGTSGSYTVNNPPKQTNYDSIINDMSQKYNVDTELIKKVMQTESNFNSDAVSKSGAMGLMQLMPKTAAGLGVKDPFDPRQNIEGGVKYLRNMLDRYGNDTKLALAAYNAGPGNVDKYGGVPPFNETQNYVKKILG